MTRALTLADARADARMRLNKIKTYTLNSDAKCNTSALNLLDFPFLGAAFASSKCSGRRRVVRPDEHVWGFFELLRHLSLKLFDQEPTLANSIIIWNDLALDHWPRRFGRCGINGKCYAVVIVDPHSTVSSLYANHSDRRHAFLGLARVRTDRNAEGRRLAKPIPEAFRSND